MSKKPDRAKEVAKAALEIIDNIEFYLTTEETAHIKELYKQQYTLLNNEANEANS
jgi:hypothetical protein